MPKLLPSEAMARLRKFARQSKVKDCIPLSADTWWQIYASPYVCVRSLSCYGRLGDYTTLVYSSDHVVGVKLGLYLNNEFQRCYMSGVIKRLGIEYINSSRVTTYPVYNVSTVITYFFLGPDFT